ncbi:mitochondrial fission regulator 2-like [Dendronephthya gigantea]|uniref:mitochondrial fission regulator 2-like n=1 Tax=Dendronephthya gigantea TaxID=151771 RepID=UPI00106B9350|nr:mitochondrial fission regulator 2-like [Dendronephthya gigantea]
MEPEGDINIREEIAQILAHVAEIFHRLCHTEEGENVFVRWQPICLRRDGQNKSIVRYLGDHLPRGLAFDPFLYHYRTIMESVLARKSLIREIGNRLPIQPGKRPYFYMLHKQATETYTRGVKNIHTAQFIHSTPCRNTISPESCSIAWDTINESCHENTYQNSMVVSDDAVRKITALEDELSRLRAQIAGFVLKQEDNSETTSMVLPPAPPPLPPPPPPLPTTRAVSQTPKKKIGKPPSAVNGNMLDMTAILKDLNQVKLKAVERSPGGTPIRRPPRKTKAADPASIIADALKSKFAKSRLAAASPGKENFQSNSPGNSFSNTPSPQHYLRKPLEPKVNERQSSPVEFKTHSIPLRV